MANELDETSAPVNDKGMDVRVIEKQIPVKTGWGTVLFEIILWVLAIIPGLIFTFMKIKARTHLRQLQQTINHNASQIDNYLEQRVVILQNAAKLLDKAVDLDKSVMIDVAKYRGGNGGDAARNELASKADALGLKVNVAFEAYPDLKAHNEIADAMQQNSYLQKEITAAREVYNDSVLLWNTTIQRWPVYMSVASKAGYTTRIPFSTSSEMKAKARDVFF